MDRCFSVEYWWRLSVSYSPRRPFSELDITSVRVDVGGTPTTLTQKLEDIDIQGSDAVPSGQVSIYVGAVGEISYIRIAAADIADGQDVDVTYNYSFHDDHESPDFDRFFPLAARTGGDGIHEFVFSRASEIRAQSISELDEIAEIIQGRRGRFYAEGNSGRS